MIRKAGFLIFFALFVLAPDPAPRLMGRGKPDNAFRSDFIQADSLYNSGQFRKALQKYRNIPVSNDPALQFKIAYAAFKSQQYERSEKLFYELYAKRKFLPPFSAYFYIKSLWQIEPGNAARQARQFLAEFNKHVLADSLLMPLAAYYFDQKEYRLAADYYSRASKRYTLRSYRPQALIRAAQAFGKDGQRASADKLFLTLLKKYPKDELTLKLLSQLHEQRPDFSAKHLLLIVNIYIKNKRYRTASALLKNFIRSQSTEQEKEKARFYLLSIYYYQGKYRSALYGLDRLQLSKANRSLEDDRLLFIARCYRKLGQTEKAVRAYLHYADLYANKPKAAEAVWQSAWLYEKKNKPHKAIDLYKRLCKRWPRNALCDEARFKTGLIYFKEGSFAKAKNVFDKLRTKGRSDFERNRAQYWAALCLDELNSSGQAGRLRKQIARNLWDDYYTMRSYLWHKEELDTTLRFIKEFKRSSRPLLYYAGGLGNRLPDLEKALQVQELLGSRFGKILLDQLKPSLLSLHEWIALAEFYKRFALYGEAYKTYDYINRRFFSKLSYVEKAFMLKERFPLYYDGLIEKYCRRYKLEPELVMALIKQESVFDPRAHSAANAFGLMQLIPPTANDMAAVAGLRIRDKSQLFGLDLNIHLGTLYLKLLSARFQGRKEYILAAYNAGPHRVQRWLKKSAAQRTDLFVENIEFSETRNYVRKVLKNYWAYKILNKNFAVDAHEMLGFSGN